jgi:type VI secretion system ImpB/VipA family protein
MMSEGNSRVGKRKDKPRTWIFYEVEKNGAMQKVDLPFDIGVFSDLSGDRKRQKSLKRRELSLLESKDDLNELVGQIKPMVMVNIQIGDQVKKIPIEINDMKDFTPDELLEQLGRQLDGVSEILQLRESLMKFREMANVDPEFEENVRQLSKQGPEALKEYLGRLG